MFHTFLVKIVILSIIVSQVNAKYCQTIASICDCSYTHHDLFWNTHNIHCPKQINGSAYEYTVRLIDTVSVQIECHNNSALNKLPMLNLNSYLYKVEFKNCFTNNKNFTNYHFELVQFLVRQLNIKVYKTINIVFHDSGIVEEKTFFTNLESLKISNLKVENIRFETSEVLRNCSNLQVVNATNTDLVNFDQFNQTGCDSMRIFIVRNTKTIKNLNRANMLKINNLEELKIYSSGIVDYYDQMYKEGAIFEMGSLKYLVLESTFNNIGEKILLNETLLKGVNLFSLSLTDLKLEELPSKLLWEQQSLSILNLNKNQLVTLGANLLVNCKKLKVIDLSDNNLVRFEDITTISSIISLTELRLSYNQLETFRFDLPPNSNFTTIYLDHNYIKTEGDTCPVTGIRNRRGIIDLSYNQITKSRPILECLKSNKELKSLDVSHNQIIDLAFEDALPYGRPAIFSTRINLANNKITYLDFLSYSEVNATLPTNDVNVYLDSNPLFCHNCLNIKKMFNTPRIHYAINRTNFKIHHPAKCVSSTQCLMSEIDKNFKCPTPCDCLYDEYAKTFLIDCENNNLTSVPYINANDLLQINFDKLLLNLQFNRLTNISFTNVSKEIIQKLHTINLENNLIVSVRFRPLEFPTNISVLQLASNRILEFEETTLELLNSRGYSLSVTLANNSIVTNRYLFEKLKTLHKFKISDLMEIRDEVKIEKSPINGSSSSSIGVLFSSIIMLFLVVIAGFIMMYTYRRLGGANAFQRLRDRTATSEMMLGGFQDD